METTVQRNSLHLALAIFIGEDLQKLLLPIAKNVKPHYELRRDQWRSVKVVTEYPTIFRINKYLHCLWSFKWQVQLPFNLLALLNFNIMNAEAARP